MRRISQHSRSSAGWTSERVPRMNIPKLESISHGITWHSYTLNWNTDFLKRSSYKYTIYVRIYTIFIYIYTHTICFPLAAKKDIFLVGTMIKFLGLGIKTKIRLPRKGDPENLMEQWIEALGFLLQVSRVNSQIKKKKYRSSLKLKQPEISVQNEKAFERWFEPDSELFLSFREG